MDKTENMIEVRVENDLARILELVEQGYCPVECSVDGQSIIDELAMDHHGPNSHLEAVSIRAWRDHFGARRGDPRFVIAGSADADATFAVAALAGILPHPDRAEELAHLPDGVRHRYTRDISGLAQTIAIIDTEPIGVDLRALEDSELWMIWESLSGGGRDRLSGFAGVALWRVLTTSRPEKLAPFRAAADQVETLRRDAALADLHERGKIIGRVLVIAGSRVFGFSEWYNRLESNGAYDQASGWAHPVVMSWVEGRGQVTIGCPNVKVAEELFGSGGLKNLFATLEPAGWGGREAVGGSPRGASLTSEQVEQAAAVISRFLETDGEVVDL